MSPPIRTVRPRLRRCQACIERMHKYSPLVASGTGCASSESCAIRDMALHLASTVSASVTAFSGVSDCGIEPLKPTMSHSGFGWYDLMSCRATAVSWNARCGPMHGGGPRQPNWPKRNAIKLVSVVWSALPASCPDVLRRPTGRVRSAASLLFHLNFSLHTLCQVLESIYPTELTSQCHPFSLRPSSSKAHTRTFRKGSPDRC